MFNGQPHSSTVRPKDGGKNKVCLALAELPVGRLQYAPRFDQHKLFGTADLDGMPSVIAAYQRSSEVDADRLYRATSPKPINITGVALERASHTDSKAAQCSWNSSSIYGPQFLVAGIHHGGLTNTSLTDADVLHALAHFLCPSNLPMHGFEFVTIFLDLVEKFGLESTSGKEAKKIVKAHLIGRKIKTFKRGPVVKTQDEIIAELMKIHATL